MRHPRTCLLLALPLLLGACRESKVAAYRIPKEKDALVVEAAAAPHPGMPGAGDMSGMAVAKADGPGLTWTAPPQWQSKPASGMRKATFVIQHLLRVKADGFRPFHQLNHFDQLLSGLDVADVVLPALQPLREINLA